MKKAGRVVFILFFSVIALWGMVGIAASWDMTTVESGALDAGEPDVDLLIDSGNVPHIAYYRYSLNQLGYAQDSGSGWVVETAASGSYADGDEPSLAIAPSSGYPSITYGTHGEGTAGDTSLYCTSYDGSIWSSESVDYWMNGLSGTSHAYDGANYPVAAYINAETYEAVYAEFDGSNWNQSVIDSDANNAAPSLAFTPSSDPAVAFEDQDGFSSALVYTWFDGSSWNPQQVDTMPSAMGIDLAFTPGGYPAISYLAGTAMVDLYYAVYDGSSWNVETVLTNPASVNTDLEFDADGNPVICYVNNNALELQRWDGATWQQETVHSDALEDAALDFLADGRAMIAAGNSSGDVLVFTESGGASPAEYYVDINNGNDTTGDGSSGNPWQTLHYGVSQLTAGDTLHLAAGTYSIANGETDGPLVINNDNITIQGAGAGQTIIDGSGAASWASGLEIANSTDNCYLADLEIGNFLTSGIQLTQTTNTTVIRCELHDNNQGVRLLNCDNTNAVRQNKVWDNYIGIYVYGDMTDCSPAIINNLIYENVPETVYIGVYIGGVSTGGTASPTIYHNTINRGGAYGIALEQDTETLMPDIRYNNITGFDYGVYTILGTPAPVLDYNNVWGHVTANYSGDLTPGPHCISADPLYTDPAVFDYHLPADSPCVDAAVTSPTTTDLDGTDRTAEGDYPDIGCYEHLIIPTGNLPPENPAYVSPAPFAVFAPGEDVTLQASAFSDPEGDNHLRTYWRVTRADINYFSDEPGPFNYEAEGMDLTSYTIDGRDFVEGLAYRWIVGHQDDGSYQYAWSQEPSESAIPPDVFVVGVTETAALPPVERGVTVADYRMVSMTHIPQDPRAVAVFGDDLAGSYSPAQYRMGMYDPEFKSGAYREYPDFMVYPGGAVWVLARGGATFDVSGVPLTTKVDVETSLRYNPASDNGWNMVGPPNNRDYLWSEVEVVVYDPETGQVLFSDWIGNLPPDNPYIDTRLWAWDSGKYITDVSTMAAGAGYWVRARQENVNLRFPGSFGGGGMLIGAIGWPAPKLLFARGRDYLRRLAGKVWRPSEAIAQDGESPPQPMNGFSFSDSGDSSSVDVSCFLSSLKRE